MLSSETFGSLLKFTFSLDVSSPYRCIMLKLKLTRVSIFIRIKSLCCAQPVKLSRKDLLYLECGRVQFGAVVDIQLAYSGCTVDCVLSMKFCLPDSS